MSKFTESSLGIVIIVSALVFFYLIPLEIQYSKSSLYEGIIIVTIALLMLGIYLVFKSYNLQEGILPIIVLLVFPLFAFIHFYIISDYIKGNLLRKDGIKTWGIVKEKWISNSKGSRGDWLYKAEYNTLKKVLLTDAEKDKLKQIDIDNSVLIMY